MKSDDIYKTPRLYVEADLEEGRSLTPDEAAHHYLRNVLRRQAGDTIRLFNGRDGEWAAEIKEIKKKTIRFVCIKSLRAQPEGRRNIHLIFAPLKKKRMDILVEKAVELGVSEMTPVFTQFTDVREIRQDRLTRQIIEAAEQSERLSVPVINAPVSLAPDFLSQIEDEETRHIYAHHIYVCLARANNPLLAKQIENGSDITIMIGPEGGFSDREVILMRENKVFLPVSLGPHVLRAETAALAALVQATT